MSCIKYSNKISTKTQRKRIVKLNLEIRQISSPLKTPKTKHTHTIIIVNAKQTKNNMSINQLKCKSHKRVKYPGNKEITVTSKDNCNDIILLQSPNMKLTCKASS